MRWVLLFICTLLAQASEIGTSSVRAEASFHVMRVVPDAYRDMAPRAFAARNGTLYFLLSNRSGLHAVARLSGRGRLLGVFRLPAYRLVQDWLQVDDDGIVSVRRLVSQSGGAVERVLRFDSAGREAETWEFRPGFSVSAMEGGRLTGVTNLDQVETFRAGVPAGRWKWRDAGQRASETDKCGPHQQRQRCRDRWNCRARLSSRPEYGKAYSEVFRGPRHRREEERKQRRTTGERRDDS